jgi:hypothetical protein
MVFSDVGGTAMSETLTLEIPDELAQRARALAAATHRRLEDAAVDSLRRAVEEPAVETVGDRELLALCDATLDAADQDSLSDLLTGHREGTLVGADKARLDALLDAYRRGLVVKARAWKEAIARGLRPPLSNDGA